MRLYRLAALLEMPVLTLIDGREPPVDDEQSGAESGLALARLARTIATMPTPTVSVILGEVCGAHAMAFAPADRTLMLEHAVFSTASPEPESGTGSRAAKPVVLSARDCRRLGLVDSIIPEPGAGAHDDPAGAAQCSRLAISRALGELGGSGPRRLQDERFRKFRHMGLAGAAGPEAVRLEIAQLQELQRTVGKSLDELRERLETHHVPIPSLPHLPSLPGMPAMPVSLRPNLPAIRRPAVNRAEIADLAGRLASTGREFAERVSDVRSTLTATEHGSAARAPEEDRDDRTPPGGPVHSREN
jgi:enoyl-CoA hydratase/carnithine racemase